MTAADRAAALGVTAPRPIELTDDLRQALTSVSTATLTSQLQRRGIRSTYFTGLRPLRPGRRLLGYAYTLRYVPQREDLLDQLQAGLERAEAGRGVHRPGRGARHRGPGAGRGRHDRRHPRHARLPTRRGRHRHRRLCPRQPIGVPHGAARLRSRAARATLGRLHLPLDTNVPIACAGVLVMPGDLVVGDDEGAMVLPAALAEEVARDAVLQEEQEAFALERVTAGESIVGLYPLADSLPRRLRDLAIAARAP